MTVLTLPPSMAARAESAQLSNNIPGVNATLRLTPLRAQKAAVGGAFFHYGVFILN